MQDLYIKIQNSKLRQIICCLLYLSLLIVCLMYFQGGKMISGAIILTALFIWAYFIQPSYIIAIHINENGQAFLYFSNRKTIAYSAQLQKGSLISLYACFLKWKYHDKIIWQVILPDMIDREDFRRLRVWARFGQKQN